MAHPYGNLGEKQAGGIEMAGMNDNETVGCGMDVIYLLNSLCIGGSESKTVRIANGLAERGLRVGIAYLNGPEDLLQSLNERVERWYLSRKGKFSPATVARLRRIFKSARPKVVIAVNLYPLIYLAPASLLAGIRKPKTVSLLNTSTPTEAYSPAKRLLYSALLGCIDYIVHGCEANRSQWHTPRSIAWRHSGVIYNGVDTRRMHPEALAASVQECRRSLRVPVNRFVLGSVGRLVPEKNQRLLLNVLRRVRDQGLDAHLLLAGDGPLRGELESHACDIGVLAEVTFTGALQDVRPALKAMDLFVLPSIAVETFSNAALEAMAMRLPVILSDIGGAAEMIGDGVEGIIMNRAVMEEVLPHLVLHLADDPQWRARLGSAARRRVEERFSVESMLDHHKALIP